MEQKVKPTDQDMTAAVTALKSAGVKAIVISVGPRQVAPIMVGTEAAGLKVPVLSHWSVPWLCGAGHFNGAVRSA